MSRRAQPEKSLRETIAALSPDKRALLEQRLMALGPRPAAALFRREREDRCVLSFAQQRLWFLDQLEPGSAVYNVTRAVRLAGALDRDALHGALGAIVARHQALRTTFPAEGGEPVAVVGDPRPVEVPAVDLAGWPRTAREAETQRRLAEEARRPFDLTRDLLLRGLLVRQGPTEHVLLLVMHHIAADGWSVGILFQELSALYRAFTRGAPSPLPPLPIQYADYAVWQRQWLQGEPLTRQLDYWTRQLAGAPPALELPADHPRPAVLSSRGARHARLLPARLVDTLKTLARQERATPFAALFAAFQTLLHRYSGQADLVVGTAIAGRTRLETEPLIGFFVNTLALRADCSGDPPFREFLGRVRDTTLGAFAHQDLPFERLVESLRPERSGDRAPLVQVMFVLQDDRRPDLALPGLAVSRLAADTGTTKFDLTASLTETAGGLHVTFEYSTDLFEAATIERMLGHYEHLLDSIVADPDRPLSRLPLLTDPERRQLLVDWNPTVWDFPRDAPLHALFEAQVARTPDALAVVFDDQQLTYRELDRRANRLAHALRARGVGPDTLVALCLERSPALVVALLAILKAGGAYIPLDPAYPPERLRVMLADAGPAALIVHARTAGTLPATQVPLVDLDADAETIAAHPDAPPSCAADGSSLAYVLYTSGSTGQPKGVAVPQRAVTRLVVNTNYVALGPADVMAQISNISFDAATFEIWGALLHGARLVILPKEVVVTPRDLALALDRHRITTLFLTTALFNQVAREAPAAFRGVRDCLVGGEAVDPRWMREVLEHEPPQRLLHVYGPTETTTFASWHEVQSVAPGALTIPIGRPIGNTELYILDRQLCPVPIGVVGELCVGGPGLARGYLNRPELTAERFVPHPFGTDPGARLYRTGDLARFLPDGTIEFIGRADQQVKIRGHRIEPGEIEAALGRHPLVRQAMVAARDHLSTGRQLVAYVAADPAGAPQAGELRAFLRQTLPEYMVPPVFVLLDHLPLTANGKVDRAALPEPALGRGAQHDRPLVAPRSPLDQLLVQIWEELLDVHPVGINDDFFGLGGHSLLAVRLVDAIQRACGRRLPLAALFEHATIESLASLLLREEVEALHAPAIPIKASGGRPPFFFLHGDYTGGGFYCRGLASRMDPEQPFWVLHPHGLDGGPVPPSIEAMAADRVRTLRALRPVGPYLLGGYCNGGLVALEMARQLRETGQEIGLLVLLDATAPRGWRRALLGAGTALGRLRGLDEARLRDLRVRLRARALQVEQRASYYRGRARLVARGGAGEMTALLRRTLLGGRGPAVAAEPPSSTPSAGEAPTLAQAYHRAIEGYLPRRYRGPVTLIRFAETHPDSPDLGWAPLADRVEVHVVPGNHFGAITRHAAALGDRLRQCLREAIAP